MHICLIDQITCRLYSIDSKLVFDYYHSSLLAAQIRVERRRKGRRKPNVFLDNRGHADPQQDWEWLQEADFGKILRRRRRLHDIPTQLDPSFNVQFDEAKHGAYLRDKLKIDHLPADKQAQLVDLIKRKWGVFNPEGMSIPVLDYECNIDTGSAAPIRSKRVNFGPNESKVMQPMIDKLEALGQIYQIFEGEWLSPALLAPKPHQEHVFDIADFIWRLCVNYIALNRVTKIIGYPIPRCDFAAMISMGSGKWRWLLDAPQGFHQIAVNKSSQEKLAFAGPYTRKYTWRVMPFGPVNGPVTFVIFIYDCKADWDDLATTRGINVGHGTDSVIIIDDIHAVSDAWNSALRYFESQLDVCLHRRLSLNLGKCHLFKPRFEFVGHDIAEDGTHPAQSKFDLVKNWPNPKTVRDVASLIGFAQFYSCYIPWLEVRNRHLRALVAGDYEAAITPEMWTDKCQSEWDFLKRSITDDPCIMQYEPSRRFYLKTDFAQVGMGYVGCQPDSDPVSLAAMKREIDGGECEFLKNAKDIGAPPRLRPICMGSRKNKGYELRLHSHLGEAFALDYSINCCRLYCWGFRFTNIGDCYSLKFLMTYEGNNPVILRIQQRLLLWAVDIVHRTRDFNTYSDYMSKLAINARFDPLLARYLLHAAELRDKYPPPGGEMKPEHMPGYRAKRRHHTDKTQFDILPGVRIDGVPVEDLQQPPPITAEAAHTHQLHLAVLADAQRDADSFSIYPISYFAPSANSAHTFVTTRSQARAAARQANLPSSDSVTPPTVDAQPSQNEPELANSDIPSVTRQLSTYQVMLYGFGGGHIHHNLLTQSLPLQIVAAADLDSEARAVMQEDMCIPPMIVERLNRYFNKSLKIFTAEHNNDPRTAHEGLGMALYAWNCAPIPGTDISRCLMVTGREWRFPIDFCKDMHLELVSRPKHLRSFARRQAELLSACRELGKVLIDEHRTYHRELINAARPDPRIFEPGDHVFARRSVQSNLKRNIVGKLEFFYTGPWIILRRLHGASYECKHSTSGKIDKFHNRDLSPVPKELITFAPIDGPDTRYGQLNRPLSEDAYKAAGIKGFLPPQPIAFPKKVRFADDHIPGSPSPLASIDSSNNLIDFGHDGDDEALHFPTLSELNDEINISCDTEYDDMIEDLSPFDSATIPTLAAATPLPSAANLAAKLVSSTSRLFFISWCQPASCRREWHLVQVQLDASLSLNPDCLHNGRYLVNFFIIHPKDKAQHPRNQRWWLEYHPASTVARIHQGDYHLLRPDSYAPVYAKENCLHPFCQWVNLLHDDTYIHGPFEFATINGRLTRDRIAVDDWTQLRLARNKYDDAPPDLDINDFTGIQFTRSFHTAVSDPAVHARVLATQFTQPESYSTISFVP